MQFWQPGRQYLDKRRRRFCSMTKRGLKNLKTTPRQNTPMEKRMQINPKKPLKSLEKRPKTLCSLSEKGGKTQLIQNKFPSKCFNGHLDCSHDDTTVRKSAKARRNFAQCPKK